MLCSQSVITSPNAVRQDMLRKYVSSMEGELNDLASGMQHQVFTSGDGHNYKPTVGPSAGTQLTDKWQRKMSSIAAPTNSSDKIETAFHTKVDLKQMLMSLQ